MPDLSPYTPALYLPGWLGRYRSYPHNVRTPIPGAGYKAQLAWAEQEINLDGQQPGIPLTRYGHYAPAPLLGLGSFEGPALGQPVMPVMPARTYTLQTVAAAALGSWAVGWFAGAWWGRKMKANRRRVRRNRRRR